MRYKSKIVILLTLLVILNSVTMFETGNATQYSQNDANSGKDARGSGDCVTSKTIKVQLNTKYDARMGLSLIDEGTINEDTGDCYLLDPILNTPGYLEIEGLFGSSNDNSIRRIGFFYVDSVNTDDHEEYERMGSYDPRWYGNITNTYKFQIPIIRSDLILVSFSLGMYPDIENQDIIDYQFSFTFNEGDVPSQNDGGFGGDAPQSESTEFPEINFDQSVTGTAGKGMVTEEGTVDEEDIYTINIEEPGYLTLEASTNKEIDNGWWGEYIGIQKRTGLGYDWTTDGFLDRKTGNQGNHQEDIIITVPRIYYVMCRFSGSVNVIYNFTIHFQPDQTLYQSDGGYQGDAGDITGVTHKFNNTITGQIGMRLGGEWYMSDRWDEYRFPVVTSGTFNLRIEILNPQNLDSSLYLRLGMSESCYFEHPDPVEGHRMTNDDIFYNHQIATNRSIDSTKTIFEGTVETPELSDCFYNNGTMFSNYMYGVTLSTQAEYLEYSFTLNFTPNEDEIQDDSEQLEMKGLDLILVIGGLLLLVGLTGYLVNIHITPNNGKISKSVKLVIKEVLGNKTTHFLLLGQNFIVDDDDLEIKFKEDFPPELLKEKFLLHPVRLAICKILFTNTQLSSSEVRARLDIPWGDYTSHTKVLNKRGLIRLEDKIVDGIRKQVISLEPAGEEKFKNLINMLIDYLDELV